MNANFPFRARLPRASPSQLLVGVTLLVFAGCGDSAEPSHLEHLIPPHKPDTLATAAVELRRRGATWSSGEATGEELTQLADIIAWLPELAADSDVRRAQWERVQAISGELAALHRSAPAGSSQRWNDLITELDDIVFASTGASPDSTVARDEHAPDAPSLEEQEQP